MHLEYLTVLSFLYIFHTHAFPGCQNYFFFAKYKLYMAHTSINMFLYIYTHTLLTAI